MAVIRIRINNVELLNYELPYEIRCSFPDDREKKIRGLMNIWFINKVACVREERYKSGAFGVECPRECSVRNETCRYGSIQLGVRSRGSGLVANSYSFVTFVYCFGSSRLQAVERSHHARSRYANRAGSAPFIYPRRPQRLSHGPCVYHRYYSS